MDAALEFIPASLVYREFGIPRNLLRELADAGIVRCDERPTTPTNVLKLYSRADILKYMNQ